MSLILSFDIGYASIGWCILSSQQTEPDFLGTGVVTFPTDDCLASARRNLRRTRRHIRSTRQRIERLKKWLQHRGVLSREDLDKPGHPAPFLLAAAALQGHLTLDAWQLWTVLRWYAHNRGYDGNSRWSRDEITSEDTEKEQAALVLMKENGTATMCETVCACLKLKPAKFNQTISSALPYKTLNAAYPRRIVECEVSRILSPLIGKIPGLDAETARLILKNTELSRDERELLAGAGIKLPKRYFGGLLFGQLVPRFDNRIISRCPITWAKVYDETITAGKTDQEARKQADKFAKVPTAKSSEFLEYRFARILANLKVDGEPVDKEIRAELFALARQQGRLSESDIRKIIESHHGEATTNLEAYFKLHPDSEEALVLDPVADEVRKAEGSRAKLSPIWKHLSPSVKEAIISEWRKNKAVSLAWIAEQSGDKAAFAEAFQKDFAALKPKKGQPQFPDIDSYLIKTAVKPKIPTGRAPYARPVLKQVVEEVLEGFDPTKANRATDPEKGENKPANGVLYDLGIPSSRVRQLQAERPIDQLTNNHLVRHRLLILERLLDDILAEFCKDGKIPDQVVVEVARELKEFSGKDRVAIKSAENAKLAQHKAAEKRLRNKGIEPTYSLIRKCRIAMDLDWLCPFTHRKYGESELADLQFEHIIPRSKRLSDSMAGLVLTRPEINELKGNRTARQFILDCAHDDRILSPDNYEKWVKSLKVARKETYPDDYARQNARKRLLMIERYEEKERTFTEGMLTQTSHLIKMASGVIGDRLPSTSIGIVPGPVTAEIRKGWKLDGTLSLASPEVLRTNGEVKLKDEIRGLTHLHHALDAAVIALVWHYFPITRHGENQTGKLWAAMRKRNPNASEAAMLRSTGLYKTRLGGPPDKPQNPSAFRLELIDLDPSLKNALARSLAEARVMQHVPADRTGTKAELTTWGIVSIDGEGNLARVKLQQRTSIVENGKRKTKKKDRLERAGKLLGLQPKYGQGKLAAIKGAMIIAENYGLALDPTPTIIPFHDVTVTLANLRKANGGKPIRVLRNGMLIRISSWKGKNGIWRIQSCQASMKLDLARPHEIKSTWREVAISSLTSRGLEIIPSRYTGFPVTD
ncbi:hypothetical protein JIN85_02245 [Luteolibacter pohnpeiensis]|uniref:CRISPR-associated endonuclease Cas9 n=1 Tax=Luteolibacter pohnpeiensis TaxID=454153 RepID=A0A934S0X4_9BACT|nr:type II CRISPR RNA-guided endonuclease Cas9 [Luteolibacter pohnpeiensis]MBK1881215.1 hypothetical protein [Luteolibacter pohnpeiensis]